jgi:hypothetical protein
MDHIEKTHFFQKRLVEEFEINLGTKMVIIYNGQEKNININWINPHYLWLGENEIWVIPEKIISINGEDVKEKISKIKNEIFVERDIKKEALNNAIKKQEQFKKYGCWL